MKLITVLLFSSLLFSCASNSTKSKMTKTNVEQKIQKGKTTKAQVIEEFGSPQLINASSDGTEQWVYDYSRVDSSSTDFGALGAALVPELLILGGSVGNDTTARQQTTLSIYFNKKGLVDRYGYSRSTI